MKNLILILSFLITSALAHAGYDMKLQHTIQFKTEDGAPLPAKVYFTLNAGYDSSFLGTGCGIDINKNIGKWICWNDEKTFEYLWGQGKNLVTDESGGLIVPMEEKSHLWFNTKDWYVFMERLDWIEFSSCHGTSVVKTQLCDMSDDTLDNKYCQNAFAKYGTSFRIASRDGKVVKYLPMSITHEDIYPPRGEQNAKGYSSKEEVFGQSVLKGTNTTRNFSFRNNLVMGLIWSAKDNGYSKEEQDVETTIKFGFTAAQLKDAIQAIDEADGCN